MRSIWLTCVMLAACGGDRSATTATTGATAAARPGPMATSSAQARPAVAPELAVPDSARLVLVASARGAQIYACAPGDGGGLAWKLHAPRAELVDDDGVAIGQHYGGIDRGKPPGPWWEAKDGSAVHGANPVSVPNPGSIPLLRLDAAAPASDAGGLLSSVGFVQRLATTGGVAPAGACTAGQTSEVPYTAKYYFYATPSSL